MIPTGGQTEYCLYRPGTFSIKDLQCRIAVQWAHFYKGSERSCP